MTLGLAAALLAAAMIGIALACKYLQKSSTARTLCIVGCALIALACKYLQKSSTARTLCIVGCALIALACAVYIGLTLLFVDAVRNSPPAA